MTKFNELGLSSKTIDAIEKKGFKEASEIQDKVIPLVLERKHDIIGVSQTGSGKTAAFGLPIIDLIDENNKAPKVIVLAPTRELALQVTAELETFKGKKRLNMLTVYGGTSIGNQIRDLRRGVDIVVGTPGRVLDLIERRALDLSAISHFVLDEADEMLRMGFIEDIELIFDKTPKSRRVLLFSATMPERIRKLSEKYMKKQIVVEVKKKIETKNNIEQSYFILRREEKFPTLCKIIDMEDFFYGIVFCMTKADVDDVTSSLKKAGYDADCIHGDIAQNKREKILKKFRDMKINILVATDVAARGIDVENLTHVINYALPKETETYVHRIGRTGRAGKSGIAVSFVSSKQMFMLKDIERFTKFKIARGNVPTDAQADSKRAEVAKKDVRDLIVNNKDASNLDLAAQLIDEFGAEAVVSSLLANINNRGKSSTDKFDSNSKNKFGKGNDKRVRLFIAKGKEDGIDKRSLFSLLEKESRISVDGDSVKINGKFSFVTVPASQAEKILDAFSKGRGRPLVERASEKKD